MESREPRVDVGLESTPGVSQMECVTSMPLTLFDTVLTPYHWAEENQCGVCEGESSGFWQNLAALK